MNTFIAANCVALFLVALCGCKREKPPMTSDSQSSKAAFVVTFAPQRCEVSGPGIDRRSMPCREVVGYVVQSLRLPPDTLFEIATIPDVNVHEFDQTMAALKKSGFRMTRGIHVNFLTEPKHDGK